MFEFVPKKIKRSLEYNFYRFMARFTYPIRSIPKDSTRIHLGCGTRKITNWLNIDLVGSDYNVDLAVKLPFESDKYEAVVSQHVVEHLYVNSELRPLLEELYRVMKKDGQVWISTPDMEKVCKAYFEDKGAKLFSDIKSRHSSFSIQDLPKQETINYLFHQGGEHRNLFDYEYLEFLLNEAGFKGVSRVSEKELLEEFPEFPERGDDFLSVYVKAIK